MSTAAIPAPTAPMPLALPEPAQFTDGVTSVADLQEIFGLGPETPSSEEPTPVERPVGDAPAEEKKDAPAEGESGAEEKPVEAADDEDPDAKALHSILARSRARRREKEAVRARAAAPAQTAPAAKPEPVAAKPDAPAPSAGVTQAVRDVLLQLDKLASDDAGAAASGTQPTTAASGERERMIDGLREKIDGIAKTLEKGDPELRDRVQTMSTALEAMENTRIARMVVTQAVDAIEGDLPTLHDPAVLRTLKRADGTRYRDPAEVVFDAAERFFNKYKVTPDFKILAKRIEKKLQSAGSEKPTGNGTQEKKSPSRKTVSSSLGSPPAARTGPDSRSRKDAESDFFAAIGGDPRA